MEILFKNGNILTMQPGKPPSEALGVQFGRIYRVGKIEDLEKLAGPETMIIDLQGQTMLPGFIDTHNHFCLYAMLTDQADCRPAAGCRRGEDVVEALKVQASKTKPGKWIMGWGYAPYLLDDQRDLTREDMDRASKKHPICLVHVSVHGCVVNSLGLKELGFTRKTADPPGGKIHRDAKGEPNGILSESAFMGPLFFQSPSIYSKVMAQYDRSGSMEVMSRCAAKFHRLGIVGAHDPFVDASTLQIYQEAANAGLFPFRLYAFIMNHWTGPLMAAGIKRGFGTEWVKVGAIKIFLDGGMSSRTAAVFKPYAYPPGAGRGILNYDQRGINKEIEKFDRARYQISVHAQGDWALEMLLKAFSRTMEKGNPLRHQIVHAGNLTPSQIDRVKDLGLYISSQANFFSLLGDGFIEAYGPDRHQELYRFRTLLQKGIKLGFSSDCPVADPNPLIGVRDSICRKTAKGQEFGTTECITPEQAIALYTREAAYFSFEEKERGTLEAGKVADMVVLDKDPLQTEPEEIPGCKVKMTVVGGKIVYDGR
ncbi:MAG TPA: amidohydrolase [Thermodesulfobacteriota bacterium]|nr:amidohydrolase [Thermodesulfobacteriota bacterium]